MADQFMTVPGGTNNHNYANVQLIVDCAKRTGAEAVWAGWGHASENPKLPEQLAKNDIAFIGPPQQAMWALGDKIASSIVAQVSLRPCVEDRDFADRGCADSSMDWQRSSQSFLRGRFRERQDGDSPERSLPTRDGVVDRGRDESRASYRLPGHDQSVRRRGRQGHSQMRACRRFRDQLPASAGSFNPPMR